MTEPRASASDRWFQPSLVGQLGKLRPIGNRPSAPTPFYLQRSSTLVSIPPHYQKSEMFYFTAHPEV